MDQILTPLGDALNSFLTDSNVQFVGRGIAVYVVLLWLACAYWAYRDLRARTSNPIAPYLAAVVIVLFTPILFPLGILLYRLIRPGETVAESNERAIAEEAMLREIETQPHCAICDRRVASDWLVCPTCRNQLRRACPSCSRSVELDWSACAWCGADLEARSVPVPSRPSASGRRRLQGAVPVAPSADATQPVIAGGSLEALRVDQRGGGTQLR